jgi:hypothetical protein
MLAPSPVPSVADDASPASEAVVPSPPASSPVVASHDTSGHDQVPFTHVQLVCSPPSTMVPSQAGLGESFTVYGHSS